MKRHIELKDIVSYLPYGLAGVIKSSFFEGKEDHVDIHIDNVSSLIESGRRGYLKPFLYPMSDLCKEIKFNGRKFYPIIELVKIIYPDLTLEKNFLCPLKDSAKWETGTILDHYQYRFQYFSNRFHLNTYHSVTGSDNTRSLNTLPLYDKLNELKFDYRGLIDLGMAIDVNTLESNPYE